MVELRGQTSLLRPAAVLGCCREVAAALAERSGLRGIHIVVHDSPGCLNFSAGELSMEDLEMVAGEAISICRALHGGCPIGLWSCQVGAGAEGAAFVARLSDLTGVRILAATGPICGSARGGAWVLAEGCEADSWQCPPLVPPLSAAGLASYANVLTAFSSVGSVQPVHGEGSGKAGTRSGKHFVVWNDGGVPRDVGTFIVPAEHAGTFALALVLPAGTYEFAATGMSGTIGIYSGKFSVGGDPSGAGAAGAPGPAGAISSADGWSADLPDADITESMIFMSMPGGGVTIAVGERNA